MPNDGEVVLREDGSVGLLDDGSVALFNSEDECPECCDPGCYGTFMPEGNIRLGTIGDIEVRFSWNYFDPDIDNHTNGRTISGFVEAKNNGIFPVVLNVTVTDPGLTSGMNTTQCPTTPGQITNALIDRVSRTNLGDTGTLTVEIDFVGNIGGPLVLQWPMICGDPPCNFTICQIDLEEESKINGDHYCTYSMHSWYNQFTLQPEPSTINSTLGPQPYGSKAIQEIQIGGTGIIKRWADTIREEIEVAPNFCTFRWFLDRGAAQNEPQILHEFTLTGGPWFTLREIPDDVEIPFIQASDMEIDGALVLRKHDRRDTDFNEFEYVSGAPLIRCPKWLDPTVSGSCPQYKHPPTMIPEIWGQGPYRASIDNFQIGGETYQGALDGEWTFAGEFRGCLKFIKDDFPLPPTTWWIRGMELYLVFGTPSPGLGLPSPTYNYHTWNLRFTLDRPFNPINYVLDGRGVPQADMVEGNNFLPAYRGNLSTPYQFAVDHNPTLDLTMDVEFDNV